MKRITACLLLICASFILFFNCDQNDVPLISSFKLTLNVEKTGIVTIQPGNITVSRGTYEFLFEHDTVITFKAGSINSINDTFNLIYKIPDSAAALIKNWAGDISGSASEQTLVMNSDKTVTAEFDLTGITRSDIRYAEDDSLYLIQAFVYDKDGFIKKLSEHDYNGSFIDSYSYDYDDEERLSRITYINHPDSIINEDFEYDESGKLIKVNSYGTREIIEYKTFNYNSDQQIISIIKYDKSDNKIDKRNIEYSYSGEITQIRFYDGDNNFISYIEIYYNYDKVLETLNYYNAAGEPLEVLHYEFDEYGKEIIFMNGVFDSEMSEEYNFYKNSIYETF